METKQNDMRQVRRTVGADGAGYGLLELVETGLRLPRTGRRSSSFGRNRGGGPGQFSVAMAEDMREVQKRILGGRVRAMRKPGRAPVKGRGRGETKMGCA